MSHLFVCRRLIRGSVTTGRASICSPVVIRSARPVRRMFSSEQQPTPPKSASSIFSLPSSSSPFNPWTLFATVSGVGLSSYLLYNTFVDEAKQMQTVSKSNDQQSEPKLPPPPPLVVDLPEEIEYLIIGGGTAAFAAFRSIRSNQPSAKVIVISEETHHPYMRPPNSKELSLTEPDLVRKLHFRQWNDKERSIFFEHDEFYASLNDLNKTETGGVSVVKGHRVVKIDPSDQYVILDNGQTLKYKKCLLATGGRPKDLPQLEKAPKEVRDHVIKFRTLDDFTRLDKILNAKKSVAIIGGGFLGSELACALSRKARIIKANNQIHQIVSEKGNLGRVLPEYLSKWTTEKLTEDGQFERIF